MANSLTQVQANPVQSVYTFEGIFGGRGSNQPVSVTQAVPAKHHKVYPEVDLEQIRQLLKAERSRQTQDEFTFWTLDFERMLQDDWLVTRFLIRGSKATGLSSSNDRKFKQKLYESTLDLIRACAKFRYDYRINSSTSLADFPSEWISVDGLFNHGKDQVGNPVMYLRIKLHKPKLIATKTLRHQFKRYLLYHLEKSDQELVNAPGKLICCVFDMSEATFENVDLELVSWMIKSFKICGPKLLSYAIVYNLPWFFSATFKLISNTLLSNSNRKSLKFVYGDEILEYISREELPEHVDISI